MERSVVKAPLAAEILATNLGNLAHPTLGALRLVQFSHQSDGTKALATALGEALVKCLEDRGWTLCNGDSEARAWLESLGYEVKAPGEGSEEILTEGSQEILGEVSANNSETGAHL